MGLRHSTEARSVDATRTPLQALSDQSHTREDPHTATSVQILSEDLISTTPPPHSASEEPKMPPRGDSPDSPTGPPPDPPLGGGTHSSPPPENPGHVKMVALGSTRKVKGRRGSPAGLRPFTREELEIATDNFKHKIGQGGFGAVYWGTFMGREIAVKKSLDEKFANDLITEVIILRRARHRNVIDLYGYMVHDNFMLVYEYAPNGALSAHLFGTKDEAGEHKPPPVFLPWEKRWQIANDVANGMEYLHEEQAYGSIMHRDLRAANILLNTKFEALVADFGLAKELKPEQYASMSARAGCYGYIAPELAQLGKVSAKSDVFSYGVVLLELLSGKKALYSTKDDIALSFYASRLWKTNPENFFEELIDKRLGFASAGAVEQSQMMCMANVAIRCIDHSPSFRPHFKEIVNTFIEDMNRSDYRSTSGDLTMGHTREESRGGSVAPQHMAASTS